MWIFTAIGFFSIVQKKGDTQLTVRARVGSDLDALRARLPELGPTLANAGTDYPYRARVDRETLARAMADMMRDIDYSNFKNEVHKRQGTERAQAYHRVWDVMYDVGKNAAAEPDFPAPPAGQALAYGGVVVDDEGRVLLRKVRGAYAGYVWSFAKGRADRGERPADAALREVREELGCSAEIVAPLSGWFAGETTANRYWLMKPVADLVAFDPKETEQVEWVSWSEAKERLSMTKHAVGRKRDLDVLEAARRASDGGARRG